MRWPTALCLSLALLAAPLAYGDEAVASARTQLRQAFPNVQLLTQGRQLTQIYGTPFGYGLSVEETADNFVRTYADVFGVAPVELLPGSAIGNLYTIPLLESEQADTSVGTVVCYRQYRDGLPVYRADMRLLVANRPGYPLMLANATLYDLGDWHAPQVVAQEDAAHAAATKFAPGLVNFSPAERMVWPDPDGKPRIPHVALVFTADNGLPATPYFARYEFVADAATGAILHTEDLILHTDVTGSVHGLATLPPKADYCSDEVDTPLPYAQVAIGDTVAYADAAGNFDLPNAGTAPVDVTSYLAGPYFVVADEYGPLETLTLTVTPPGPADFLHNAANDSEYIRAEVNAYLQANVVRDWALAQNPQYPVIPTQTGFPVNVNINDSCNAYYDGFSINFFRSSADPNCANTAYSNILHHEYGHHLIAVGGSGQAAYGEGMADSVALCIADDPIEGYGFENGDCDTGIRDADNTIDFPCSGEIHYCGQVLSGCVWSTRTALKATNPTTYLAIISKLTLNSIPLHGPSSSITPSIYDDFIALDDLYYDGAHHDEITAGFDAHHMLPPAPPPNDLCADALVACPGQLYTGDTTAADSDGTATCGTSSASPDAWYAYTPATSGTAHFTMCAGTAYDSVLSIHSACPGTAGNTLACNDDACGQPNNAPSEITLDVTAGTTYIIRISGWYGAAGPYGLMIAGPACQQVDYTLTTAVLPAGAGTITLDPPGGTYPPGTLVTLTAQAAAGWHFDHWTGDLSGPGNPATLTMGSDHSVTAVFGLLGDLNCDGTLGFGDINPFVLALSDPIEYGNDYPGCPILNGDINNDGTVGFGDINPFVQLLTGL